jgi:hypothetical protein
MSNARPPRLWRLRRFVLPREHRGLQSGNERMERRGVDVRVPAHMRVPEVDLADLALKRPAGRKMSHLALRQGHGGSLGLPFAFAVPEELNRGPEGSCED